MANKTRTTYPGKPGTWPGGEPKSVRDAYDKLTKQSQDLATEPAPKNK